MARGLRPEGSPDWPQEGPKVPGVSEPPPEGMSYEILNIKNMNNSRFDERRDLLVIPASLKIETLHKDARDMVNRLIRENKVIRLNHLKKPATVRV